MFGLQPMHLILILAIALIIFGPSRIPDIAKSLGKGIQEFKKSSKEITDDFNKSIEDDSDKDKKE